MSDHELAKAAAGGDDEMRHALAVLQAATVVPEAVRRTEAVVSEDCDHALKVLAAATVLPDEGRRAAVTTEAGHALKVLAAAMVPTDAARRAQPEPKAPLFGLHHFALAAAVCFTVGLVVLFKVAFTPPERIDVVALTNTLVPATNAPVAPIIDEANEPGRNGDEGTEPDVAAPGAGDLTGGGIGMGGGTGGGGAPTTGGSNDGDEGPTTPPDDKPVKPDLPAGGTGGG